MGNINNKERGIAHILVLVIVLGLLALIVYFFTSGRFSNFLGNLQINQKSVFAEQTHPFLIVKQEDFQTLRDKASSEPWKAMKTKAATDSANLNYDPSQPIKTKSDRLRDIVSAAALSYILEPDASASAVYKDKVKNTLMNWDDIYPALNCSDWNTTVPPGYAFFNSVLALDIVYNDLTPEEKSALESKLDNVAEWYWSNNCSWETNQYAVRGIWALFQADRTRIDNAKNAYKSTNLGYFTSDGVFDQGPGYAWGRLGTGRDSKVYFMDVLEFTGEDSYYSNPEFIKFYEWLYSGSMTPVKSKVTFGDTDTNIIGKTAFGDGATYRSDRFSSQAAKNASWAAEGAINKGRLLTYVLYDDLLPASEKPKSRIWKDGMASFWENNPATTSLMGALWNPKSSDGHSHKDVNAVHLNAYGENILRNSGYGGWGNGCGSTWTYIHDTAVSSNTVLIDGKDHVSKQGAGITEGFTSYFFDYSSGNSGSALQNGKHIRNLAFVHPDSGSVGYFILLDEVSVNGGKKNIKANIAIHPNAGSYTTTTANQEYSFPITQYGSVGVFGNVFLGTPSNLVEVKDGVLCGNNTQYPSFTGKYIYSTYNLSSGKKNIVTIIFPSDSTHPKAAMTRISGSGYTGANVDFGSSVIDTTLESAGTSNIIYSGVTFRGLATVYRTNSGANSFYFVRKGRTFNNGQTPRIGFDSNADVSIYIKDKLGNIISPGTDVTIYYPSIANVKLNGNTLTNITAGSNWVKVNIPSGTHSLEII